MWTAVLDWPWLEFWCWVWQLDHNHSQLWGRRSEGRDQTLAGRLCGVCTPSGAHSIDRHLPLRSVCVKCHSMFVYVRFSVSASEWWISTDGKGRLRMSRAWVIGPYGESQAIPGKRGLHHITHCYGYQIKSPLTGFYWWMAFWVNVFIMIFLRFYGRLYFGNGEQCQGEKLDSDLKGLI